MTTVAPHIDRAAWHAAHTGKIGSSQVPGILGIDEYVKPWEVWDEVVFGRQPHETEGADVRRGKRQEANAAARFAEETGLTIGSAAAGQQWGHGWPGQAGRRHESVR